MLFVSMGVMWYGKNKSHSESVPSAIIKIIPIQHVTVYASSSVPTTLNGITYITKTYFPSADAHGKTNKINIIEITTGLPQETMNKVNKELRTAFDYSAFGDPESPGALADMRAKYKNQAIEAKRESDTASHFSSDAEIDAMTYQEVRSSFLKDFERFEFISEGIEYLDSNVLSVRVGGEMSCEMTVCHPHQTINFDVATGNTFVLKDFFKDYEKDKTKIEAIIISRIEKDSPFEGDECTYKKDYKYGDFKFENILVVFSKEGPVTSSLGYEGSRENCNESYTIPFSLLKPYLNTTATFMKSANLDAK